MAKATKILCTGGRELTDVVMVHDTLSNVCADAVRPIIIQGGATGLDRLVYDWCQAQGVPCATVDAAWGRYGKSAGAIRNGWMLLLEPDLVVAFPGGDGTANMVRQAERAGVRVMHINQQEEASMT